MLDQLNHWAALSISRYLSRMDCINWAMVNSTCYEMVVPLCHLRLTEAQSQVVKRILSLKPDDWRTYIRENARRYQGPPTEWARLAFPKPFTVSTGPSTGKTLIALYTAAYLFKQGKAVFLTAPLKLCHQWLAEAEKFRKRFDIPPICIVHPRYNANWPSLIQQGHLPLVPDTVLRFQFSRETGRNQGIYPVHLEFFKLKHWEFCFADEVASVVSSLILHSVRARRLGKDFMMVALNASRGGDDTLAAYAADAGLGALPQLDTLVQKSVQQIASRYMENVDKSRLDLAISSILNFIVEHRGKKTILLCNMTTNIRKGQGLQKINILAYPKLMHELWRLGFTTICELNDMSSKTEMIAKFATSTEGGLAAPLHFLARGFNLYCDSALVIDCAAAFNAGTALQLIGRIRRVESPFPVVRLSILQDEPIGARQLGFHALAAGGKRETGKLISKAQWFEKGPQMVKTTDGKRQKLDYGLVNDRTAEGRRRLFQALFPEDDQYVYEFNENRLRVSTKPRS